ncbi:MAG TPA: hypothetical protein VF867_07400 [Arthrobacter sp.]
MTTRAAFTRIEQIPAGDDRTAQQKADLIANAWGAYFASVFSGPVAGGENAAAKLAEEVTEALTR